MTFVIDTRESIDNLALAIYDEKDEILREVTGDDLVFPVFATSRLIKRFFIIGELLYTNKVTITTTSADDTQYITKIAIGKDNLRYSDFSEYTSTATTTYEGALSKYYNALPVDIYVESLGYSNEDVTIDVDLVVESV